MEEVCVIIPIYNTGKYLARCIDSVINQSYKNIKIVLVDDCSNAETSDIINKYVCNYSNIYYYKNHRHLGVSKSRNKGIDITDSPYMLFLDSDDWIDLNCIEKAMIKFNSDLLIDIVIWEIQTSHYNYTLDPRYKYCNDNIISNKMAIKLLSHSFVNEYFLSPLLGCKLFKTKVIKNNKINFIDGFYEDDIFTFLSFFYSRKIGLVTNCNLYYYQREDSLLHSFSEKNIVDLFVAYQFLYDNYVETQKVEKNDFYNFFKKSLYSLRNRLEYIETDNNLKNHYKSLLLEEFSKKINIEEYYKYCFEIKI